MLVDERGRQMFVFALSSRASDVFHVASPDGTPACGARISDHHKEVGDRYDVGARMRCARPGCKEVSDA
jgi:hypothetical protein